MFGTLLVLLWCLPPLAMAASKFTFETRKQAVLHAEGAEVKDLGQHFITGYRSFAEVAPLAEKGLIGGIYISHHNIKGRTAAALKSEIASLAGAAPRRRACAADRRRRSGRRHRLAPRAAADLAAGAVDACGSSAGPARTDGRRVRPHPWPRTRRPRRDAEFCSGRRPAPLARPQPVRFQQPDQPPRHIRRSRDRRGDRGGLCAADWRRPASAPP